MKKTPSLLTRLSQDPRVQSVTDERHGNNNDGFWVYLKPGYVYDGTHAIHEDTPTRCLQILKRGVKPCSCSECLNDLRQS